MQQNQLQPKPFNKDDFRASVFGFLSQKFANNANEANTLIGQYIVKYAEDKKFKTLIDEFTLAIGDQLFNEGRQTSVFDREPVKEENLVHG